MQETVFCVDIGTSSIKTARISRDGKIISAARFRFPRRQRQASDWLDAYNLAVNTHSPTENLAALVISGNGPTLVSVDQGDRATKLLLWNEPCIESAEKPYTGTSLFIPRIQEFSRRFPAEYADARWLLSGPEYLIYALTGNAVTILPEKRFESAYWTQETLTENKLSPEKAPPFIPSGATVGTTTVGSQKNIPVIAGGPDFFVALAGTGAFEPGRACDRAGTSEGLNVCTKEPVFYSGIRTLPSVLKDYWNASWLLPDSGAIFHDYRKASGNSGTPYPALMKTILDSPIHPINKNLHPGREVVEKIGFSVRLGMETLALATGYSPEYYLSGGQARNELWNQMKADITGGVFVLTATADGELMGGAVIASPALGWYPSILDASRALVREYKRFEPNQENHHQYTEKYLAWKARHHETI